MRPHRAPRAIAARRGFACGGNENGACCHAAAGIRLDLVKNAGRSHPGDQDVHQEDSRRYRSLGGQAEPGLTAQWLELTLARHIAQMHSTSMKDCAFGVKDVKVQVDPAGTGFAVKLVARDSAQAEEVLRRARLLTQ
jgi:hypothetical protein